MKKIKKTTDKMSVQEIIVNRLIEKIKENKKLPWQRPYLETCFNYYTKKQYRGINRILLGNGSFMTVNQIKKYNKENDTSFWFIPNSNWEYICYYNNHKKEIPKKEYDKYPELKFPGDKLYFKNGYLYMDDDGKIYIVTFYLRYYVVYNTTDIVDASGNHLPEMLDVDNNITEKVEAETIVNDYCDRSGVKVSYTAKSTPGYRERTDSVLMPPKQLFLSSEKMYRDLFHELIHSTGVESRLNRSCYKLYFKDKTDIQRSKEELIAEMGSLLLATEAGFTEEYDENNSDSYILSWITYLNDNPKEVVSAMSAAEKASQYILCGTSEKEVYKDGATRS